MSGLRNLAFRGAFETLYFSGLSRMLRPFVGGVGAILTLHHVRPASARAFQPNLFLEITPDFLDATIRRLKRDNFDIVSLDELHRRLAERDFDRPFVAITLDDGYRDNKMHALPVFKKHGVPFTVFVPTSFPERRGLLWWVVLEQAVAGNDAIAVVMDGTQRRLSCATLAEKHAVYLTLRAWLASLPSEAAMLDAVRGLAARYKIDMAAICGALCMNWDEIAAFAAEPLVTIGAHTVNHIMLGRADETTVRSEMAESRAVLEAKLGREVRHFAYPYGDALNAGPREQAIAGELGYKTAVTTQASVLQAGQGARPTALPRITLSGEFQRERYVDVLVSGAVTALWSGFRRLKPA
jgi:peptidoglycan/xylan/chitin deacetylase (PgdA/CDA1 family)